MWHNGAVDSVLRVISILLCSEESAAGLDLSWLAKLGFTDRRREEGEGGRVSEKKMAGGKMGEGTDLLAVS